mmetsp:Transcript_25444/g.31208  ORF Transcript_25444/g.31208 Transcript_25444/m.31208 type:complete len:207 (+) Transcript_25444:292-912(+)
MASFDVTDLEEQFLDHDHDHEAASAVEIPECVDAKTSTTCSRIRQFSNFILPLSIFLNVGLGFGFLILLKETDVSDIPAPPPTPNSSYYTCPFPELDLSKDRFDPAIAKTSTGADFTSVCWRDFTPDTREESQGYSLLLDDFWTQNQVTVYTGRDVKQNITNLLPDSDYTLRVYSLTNKSKNAKISFRTIPRGYCGNEVGIYNSHS